MAITASKPRANAKQNVGNFWWTDLQTTDPAGSREFYGRVLGWDFEEVTHGGETMYFIANIEGLKLAGFSPVVSEMNMTFWTNFVNVDDVAATAERVTQLGGSIMAEPMEVPGQGHLAVVTDPTGAAFGLWQPTQMHGADAVNQPSTFTWTDLATDDVESAKRFYGELFGWGTDVMGDGYWTWEHADNNGSFAGLMAKPEQMSNMPNAWSTYYGVADIEAAVAEAKAAGGTVVLGPDKMGPGTGAGIIDPQGGFVMLFELDEWPA